MALQCSYAEPPVNQAFSANVRRQPSSPWLDLLDGIVRSFPFALMNAATPNTNTAKDAELAATKPDLLALRKVPTILSESFRAPHNWSAWSRRLSGLSDFSAAACHPTAFWPRRRSSSSTNPATPPRGRLIGKCANRSPRPQPPQSGGRRSTKSSSVPGIKASPTAVSCRRALPRSSTKSAPRPHALRDLPRALPGLRCFPSPQPPRPGRAQPVGPVRQLKFRRRSVRSRASSHRAWPLFAAKFCPNQQSAPGNARSNSGRPSHPAR